MSDGQDRQHNATQNRLQKALQDGRFARSQQLTSLLFLVGAFAVMLLLGHGVISQLIEQVKSHLGSQVDISGNNAVTTISRNIWQSLSTLAPLFAMLACVAYMAHGWQSGFKIFPNKLSFDPSRITLASGVQKLFSGRNFIKAIGGISRLLIVVGAGLYLIWCQKVRLMSLAVQSRESIPHIGLEIGCWIVGGVIVIMAFFAVIDYLWKCNTHQHDLKLTDQEYRDEMKSLEGDPLIRSNRRSRHTEMAEARLSISAVQHADIVICGREGNVAAIKVNDDKQATLIAKGTKVIGRQIVNTANQNQIPIIANDQAAAFLSDNIDINSIVPRDLLRDLLQSYSKS